MMQLIGSKYVLLCLLDIKTLAEEQAFVGYDKYALRVSHTFQNIKII
jgi:hypothetical protein